MRWQKLGHIFNPTDHLLPHGCVQYAQSPQTLILHDRVRIYFASRSIDTNGKFLSHVLYVDFDHSMNKLLAISDHEVISLGGLGTFDEHGIFPLNVLQHDNQIYGYTCGWNRRVSVSVDTGIGLAISSDDGRTFHRIGEGPIVTSSLNEPFLVGDAFVRCIQCTFHMWYIFGTAWKKYSSSTTPDRTYKIGHSTSLDGINWVKEESRQIIADAIGAQESQALPTVIEINNTWHMFFCFRESFDFRTANGRGYRLGHAYSENLRDWTRDDTILSLKGTDYSWDSDMQCYPHVFELNQQIFLLYNGNSFGKYGFGLARLIHD